MEIHKWILTVTKQPPIGETVHVVYGDGSTGIAKRVDKNYYIPFNKYFAVIQWRPLESEGAK